MTIRLNRTESALFLLIQNGHLYPDGAAGIGKHYTAKLRAAIHSHSYGGPVPGLYFHRADKRYKVYAALATALLLEGVSFYEAEWPRKGVQARRWRMHSIDANIVHVRRVRGVLLVTGSMAHPTRGTGRVFCSDTPVRDFLRLAAANLGAYRAANPTAFSVNTQASSGPTNLQNLPKATR